MDGLEKRVQEIVERESKLLDLLLESKISQEIFDKKREEFESDKAKANSEREMHQNADKGFKDTIVTAFQLISQAYDLFQSSKNEQKRQLINFVFSNLQLKGSKLCYDLRQPFNLLVNLQNQPCWRSKEPLLQTFLALFRCR